MACVPAPGRCGRDDSRGWRRPVLAHGGAGLRHMGISNETLHSFLDFGLAGLECYAHYRGEAAPRFCLNWREPYDLLVAGGWIATGIRRVSQSSIPLICGWGSWLSG
jgi:hypothetical protein